MQKIPLPREHGAWVMLFTPCILGTLLAPQIALHVVLLYIAILGAFLARHPFIFLLKTRTHKNREAQRQHMTMWLALYGVVSMGAGALLLFAYQLTWLLYFAFAAVIGLGLDTWWHLKREGMSAKAEYAGVIAMSLSAPAAYYVASGTLPWQAFALCLLCILYFGGSIFYVKLKVRTQPKAPCPVSTLQKLRVGKVNATYHLFALTLVSILAALGTLPLWTPLAFLPVTIKAMWGTFQWQTKQELNLMRLGIYECVHALVFSVMIILTFV